MAFATRAAGGQSEDREGPLLVLGGGICGLAAAEEAGRRGRRAVVVEAQSTPGGMLRTDERSGFRFDRGGHRFITSIPWVLDRVRELCGDRLQARERRSFLLLDGTRVRYPLELSDLLTRLGPWKNLRALGSYVAGRAWPRGSDPSTLEGWLRRRFGNYLYGAVFEGYTEKLWGVPASSISSEWASERISIPSLGGFLRELLLRSGRPPRTYARRYLYPRLGIGEIPEAFARSVRESGGVVRTGSRVRSLERVHSRWRARIETPDGMLDAEYSGIVSTIPVDDLARLLGISTPPADKELPYRALRFLNLGFSRPVPLDATWIYHADPASPFTRIQIPAARSPEMVPQGCGSIQLEQPVRTPVGAGQPSAEGIAESTAAAMRVLRGQWPDLPDPLFAFTTLERQAYPVYLRGARERAGEILRSVQTSPDLVSAGRQGKFSYIFFDRAIAEGVNAVRSLLGEAELSEGARGRDDRPMPIEAQSILERPVGAVSAP